MGRMEMLTDPGDPSVSALLYGAFGQIASILKVIDAQGSVKQELRGLKDGQTAIVIQHRPSKASANAICLTFRAISKGQANSRLAEVASRSWEEAFEYASFMMRTVFTGVPPTDIV